MENNKITKVMDAITKQKEKIANEKERISLAEGRRTANLEAIEQEKEKIKTLGYDPEKIDEVFTSLNDEISNIEQQIDDIYEELENFDL